MPDTPTTRFEDRFATWLQGALRDPGTRSALRAGENAATVERAYPHLARWWAGAPYREQPLLLVTGLIARTGIPHRPGISVGQAARRATRHASPDGIDTRILAAYRQPIARAHAHLGAVLRIAATNGIGVDHAHLIRTYLQWDNQNDRYARRRLLNDYYGTAPARTTPPTDLA